MRSLVQAGEVSRGHRGAMAASRVCNLAGRCGTEEGGWCRTNNDASPRLMPKLINEIISKDPHAGSCTEKLVNNSSDFPFLSGFKIFSMWFLCPRGCPCWTSGIRPGQNVTFDLKSRLNTNLKISYFIGIVLPGISQRLY